MPSTKQSIKRSIDKSNKLKDDAEFKSTHNLPFEIAPFYADNVLRYRVGTCTGIYNWDANNYTIIAITNDNKGNGHLQDVFEWFENSCKRDKKNLLVAEIMNKGFMKHLIEKRGFDLINGNYAIKLLKEIK